MKQIIVKNLVAVLLAVLSIGVVWAAQPGKALPFTQSENQDGAKWVWFIYGVSGMNYEYLPAKDFPGSDHFREVDRPQAADVAWWPDYVAVTKMESGKLAGYISAEGEASPSEMQERRGSPKYFRLLVGDDTAPAKDVTFDALGVPLHVRVPNATVWREADRRVDMERGRSLLMFIRAPVIDRNGASIQPVMSVIAERLPSEKLEHAQYAVLAGMGKGLQDCKTVDAKTTITLRCKYDNGMVHRLAISYGVVHGVGLQFIADTTESVLPRVQADTDAFIEAMASTIEGAN